MKKLRKLIDLTDVLVFTGTALVSAGCWFIYEPAAYLSAGIIFLGIGLKGLK